MSILESIKGERKLSLNHWRFRILHWAFNVKDPQPPNPHHPESNGIPMFLYTHYCPLFHLTNLIALLSPLILLIKVLVLVIWAIVISIAAVVHLIPVDAIFDFFTSFMPDKPNKPKKEAPKLTLEDEKLLCIKAILGGDWGCFESFWAYWSVRVSLTEEVAKALFAEYTSKKEEARKLAKLRKEKWRQRIIFWTNFSRVFIKWVMNLAYIGLAVFLIWVIYSFTGVTLHFLGWCCECVAWLFTDAISYSFLLFVGKLMLWGGLIFAFIYFLLRLNIIQRFVDAFVSGISYISPPFYIVIVPFRWMGHGFVNACEFVSMFYEENCPPIKIVSDEEAAVESIAQDGEEV